MYEISRLSKLKLIPKILEMGKFWLGQNSYDQDQFLILSTRQARHEVLKSGGVR